MAENAGHLVVVETATDGATYAEIAGGTSVSRASDRDALETTHFADASEHKTRIVGLKDGRVELSGNVSFTPVTFLLDAGFKNVVQRARDGGALSARSKMNGAAGAYLGAAGLVEEFSLSAEVGGLVEWSTTVRFNDDDWG